MLIDYATIQNQIASSFRIADLSLHRNLMAGAVSALFLLDIKGRVLIWRDYRGDVSAVQAERFFTKLIEKEVPSFFLYELNFQ